MSKTVEPHCEVKIKGAWIVVSLDEARQKYVEAPRRCPACHGAVSIVGNYTLPVKRKLTHRRMHVGCPLLSKAYCGTPSPHPNPVT